VPSSKTELPARGERLTRADELRGERSPQTRQLAVFHFADYSAASQRVYCCFQRGTTVSGKRNIPVRDSSARKILFYASRSSAQEMVDRNAAFVLANDPLEIALNSRARRTALEISELRPDQSLTMPPSVIHGAALGFSRATRIRDSYLPNQRGTYDVPNIVKPPRKRKG
jgi:hypothetical protein